MSDEKNKYITAYGSSNEDSYGRGDVTDISTKYNMLTTNPLSDGNAPDMNSYSSDGSYNQDIFGWKCFNSPVSFRNGIYGECGCVTTFNDSSYHGIEIKTYDIGDTDNQSKIIIKADHIKLDGEVDAFDLPICRSESTFELHDIQIVYMSIEVTASSSISGTTLVLDIKAGDGFTVNQDGSIDVLGSLRKYSVIPETSATISSISLYSTFTDPPTWMACLMHPAFDANLDSSSYLISATVHLESNLISQTIDLKNMQFKLMSNCTQTAGFIGKRAVFAVAVMVTRIE